MRFCVLSFPFPRGFGRGSSRLDAERFLSQAKGRTTPAMSMNSLFFGLSSSPWIDNRKKGEGRERELGQCIDQ